MKKRQRTAILFSTLFAIGCEGEQTAQSGNGGEDAGGGDRPDAGANVRDELPTVTIGDDTGGAPARGAVTFTFTFSEDVGFSFVPADVQMEGARPGRFRRISGTEATFVAHPRALSSGTIRVSVAAGSFEDLNGNPNLEGAAASAEFVTTEVEETVIYDFEAGQAAFAFVASPAFIGDDPVDPNNRVLQFDRSAEASSFEGAFLVRCPSEQLPPLPVDQVLPIFTARVWSPEAGLTIRFRLASAGIYTDAAETDALTTVANAWETLTFDLSAPVANTPALDPRGVYQNITIFPNAGQSGAQAGAQTFLFDDITVVGSAYDLTCPPAPSPSVVLADFEPGGPDFSLLDSDGPAQSAIVADPEDPSNRVARIVKDNAASASALTTLVANPGGISPVPATFAPGKTEVVMRVRVEGDAPVTLVLLMEDSAGGPPGQSTTSVSTLGFPLGNGEWLPVLFPLNAGEPPLEFGRTYDRISLAINSGLSGPDGGGGVVYVDDIALAE